MDNIGENIAGSLINATRRSSNLLYDLKTVGAHAEIIMKNAIALGAIAKTLPKPETQEFEQLLKFKTSTPEVFEAMGRKTYLYPMVYERFGTIIDTIPKVQTPIATLLKEMTLKFIDPTYLKPLTFLDDYKTSCQKGDLSPRKVLQFLDEVLVVSCSDGLNATEIQKISERRSFLGDVIRRLKLDNSKSLPMWDLFLPEFLSIVENIEESTLSEDLDCFYRTFESYDEAISTYFSELKALNNIQELKKPKEKCLLRDLLANSYFDYRTIIGFVSELKNSLLKIVFNSGICAELMFEGDQQDIEKWSMEVVGKVRLISNHTANIFNKSLAAAWPSVHEEVFLTELKDIVEEKGVFDKDELTSATVLAGPLLMEKGLPTFVYEMTIIRHEEEEYKTFHEGLPEFCVFKRDVFGYDIVLGRIPLNTTETNEPYIALHRILKLKEFAANELNEIIQKEMITLHKLDVDVIAKALKSKMPDFMNQKKFHCWTIIPRREPLVPWNHCPPIEIFEAPYSLMRLNSIYTTTYTNGTGSDICELFKFSFNS